MKNYLKFYRVLIFVSSVIVLAILIHLFIVIVTNLDKSIVLQNYIIETFAIALIFFVLVELSLKKVEKLEQEYKNELIKSKVSCKLIEKECFKDIINTLLGYLKEKYKTPVAVFLKNGDSVLPIENSTFNIDDIVSVINNKKRSIVAKLDDAECIFVIPNDSEDLIKDLKEELKNFWTLIENKFIIEESKKNIEKQKEHINRLDELVEYTAKISNTLVLEETYMWIIKASMSLFNADSVSLLDTSKGKGFYNFVGSKNLDLMEISEIENSINTPYFGEHIDAIVRTGKINYIPNTDEFPGWAYGKYSPKSWIGIPLLNLEEKVFVVINIGKNVKDYYKEEDMKFAEIFQKNINIALTKNLLLERYRMDSITDPLTKLYNRREFEERLLYEITQAQRYKTKFTLLLMDLDKFKSLNDTYGHPVGDVLLREFANVIRNSIRASDIAFRIGGDEFAVILSHADRTKAKQIATRIKNNTAKINLGVDFKPSVSIGIKEYEEEDRNELIKECDKLLYLEKPKKV